MKRLFAVLVVIALAGCAAEGGEEAMEEAPAEAVEEMQADTMPADTVMVRDTASDAQ
jgi:hypothetical protein